MTSDQNMDVSDVILFAGAVGAGGAYIEEYLRAGDTGPGIKLLRRIQKRIKHSENYTDDGKMKPAVRLKAMTLLILLAVFLGIMIYSAVRLTAYIADHGASGIFVFSDSEQPRKEGHAGIVRYMSPSSKKILSHRELTKTSLMYSMELELEDGRLYYFQCPLGSSEQEAQIAPDGREIIHVRIGEHTGKLYAVHHGGRKSFELYWSDNEHSYGLYPASSPEQAVSLAQSIYSRGP